MQTEDKKGECFIETAQLDGERNLKPKYSLKSLQHSIPKLFDQSNFEVNFTRADKAMYDFRGQIVLEKKSG